MVPVWMIFSDLLKVMIIQCQITWKWYNIQLYLQWPTNRKSFMIYRTALNDPLPPVSRSRHSLTLNIPETVRHTDIVSMNTSKDLHKPYSTVLFQMTLSELAKYSMTQSVARSLCDSWASFLLHMSLSCVTDLLTNTMTNCAYRAHQVQSSALN